MTYISTNRKWFIPTLVILSFATSLLPYSFAAPLYAQNVVKDASHSPTSYAPITPTSSTSSDSGDNQPQHHSSTSTNNQHHSSSSTSTNNQHHSSSSTSTNNQHHSSSSTSTNNQHHSSSSTSTNNQHHEHGMVSLVVVMIMRITTQLLKSILNNYMQHTTRKSNNYNLYK